MAGFQIAKTGSWKAARKKYEEAAKDPKKRLLLALKRAALMLEAEIKKGLSTGAPGGVPFRPLALSTILQRRDNSDRPLLDTGALLGSVTTQIDENKLEGVVGVNRSAGNMNVAEIHEFGTEPYAIPVTPALRAFFLRLSIISGGRILPLSKSTDVIYHPGVPARPFLRPAMEAVRPKLAAELKLAIERGD